VPAGYLIRLNNICQDTTPPTTTIDLSGTICDTSSIGPVTVDITASDFVTPQTQEIITTIYYTINSGERQTYT
jgi:hypothetical protein